MGQIGDGGPPRLDLLFLFLFISHFLFFIYKVNLNSNLTSNLVQILSSNYIKTLKVLILELYEFSLYFILSFSFLPFSSNLHLIIIIFLFSFFNFF